MAIFHLNVSTGSRGGGQSAAAKSSYVSREGKYAKGEAEVLHVEHAHMPSFAADNPQAYWEAADAHERANGRLFRQVEFALPVELTDDEKIALAHDFAQHITAAESMPYTLAIHKGEYDHQGRKTDTPENPHVHLIISERANDGIERSAEQWFKRANKANPEKGGAAKTKSLESKEWLHDIREQWAEFANAALERSGHDARIDHRTLAEQGIDRIPQIHKGAADHMSKRGIETERMAQAVIIAEDNKSLALMSHQKALEDARIERLSKAIDAVKEEAKREAQAQPEQQTDEQKIESYKRQLKSMPLGTLKAHYETQKRALDEAQSTLSWLHEQEKSAKEKYGVADFHERRAGEQLAELQQGMFAKWRNKAAIEQTTKEQAMYGRDAAKHKATLEAIPDQRKAAQSKEAEASILTELLGQCVVEVGDQEREKWLTSRGMREGTRERWQRWNDHVESLSNYQRADALTKERIKDVAFNNFKQDMSKEPPQKSNGREVKKQQNRGFER